MTTGNSSQRIAGTISKVDLIIDDIKSNPGTIPCLVAKRNEMSSTDVGSVIHRLISSGKLSQKNGGYFIAEY